MDLTMEDFLIIFNAVMELIQNLVIDTEAVDWEFGIFAYTIVLTAFVIGTVTHSIDLLDELEEGDITAINCSEDLNFVLSFKVFIHTHYSIVLLVHNHPCLFLLNVPLMIWYWFRLPVGYPVNDIEQPERISVHIGRLEMEMIHLFVMTFGFYPFYINMIGNVKMNQFEMKYERRTFQDTFTLYFQIMHLFRVGA